MSSTKSSDTRLDISAETRTVNHISFSLWCVSKKNPLVRVGFDRSRVQAECPDMDPAADSKMASGTPDASSAMRRTCSEWTP